MDIEVEISLEYGGFAVDSGSSDDDEAATDSSKDVGCFSYLDWTRPVRRFIPAFRS